MFIRTNTVDLPVYTKRSQTYTYIKSIRLYVYISTQYEIQKDIKKVYLIMFMWFILSPNKFY